jgi:hypothetical protein
LKAGETEDDRLDIADIITTIIAAIRIITQITAIRIITQIINIKATTDVDTFAIFKLNIKLK